MNRLTIVAAAIVGVLVCAAAALGALALTRPLLAGKAIAEATSTAQSGAETRPVAAPAAVTPPAEAPAAPAGEYVQGTLEQQHLWALATCGGLIEMNGERHDMLSGFDTTSGEVQACKQYLAQWWDVKNREDLLETLSWIEKEGHRALFDQVNSVVAQASAEDLAALRTRYANDPEALNQIDIAQQYGPQLGTKSIIGWDYARYVFLCRHGYACGYLSEQEAWDKIMPAARVMQSTFTSWTDLASNYSTGRRFWSLTQTQSSGAELDRCQSQLLSRPDSPWVTLPWNLDLTTPTQ